jgi:hypothetical protein
MSLHTRLEGLRVLTTHPHHIELGVLAAAGLVALVWIEIRKPEPWLQWLALSMLLGPASLFMFDDQGVGLDTSPFALGLALGVGVLGGGMITLQAFLRHERLARLEARLDESLALEKWRHARRPPLDLNG